MFGSFWYEQLMDGNAFIMAVFQVIRKLEIKKIVEARKPEKQNDLCIYS